MNILLAASSHDGPSWVAFSLESLDLELKHHKDLYDAIQLCLETKKQYGIDKVFGKGHGRFGDIISVSYGDLYEDGYFIENMLRAQAEFEDPESDEYDPRYANITLAPPFKIDEVITLTTFG